MNIVLLILTTFSSTVSLAHGSKNIDLYVSKAFGIRSTTYGHGNMFCGDVGKPAPCSKGAITASGEVFDPDIPTMAVFAPSKYIIRSTVIPVRLNNNECKFIRVNDKGNPRYIKKRGFDLTPASVKLLGGESSEYWSGKLYLCLELLGMNKAEIIKHNLK